MKNILPLALFTFLLCMLNPYVTEASILDLAESAMIRQIVLEKADSIKYKSSEDQRHYLSTSLENISKTLSLPKLKDDEKEKMMSTLQKVFFHDLAEFEPYALHPEKFLELNEASRNLLIEKYQKLSAEEASNIRVVADIKTRLTKGNLGAISEKQEAAQFFDHVHNQCQKCVNNGTLNPAQLKEITEIQKSAGTLKSTILTPLDERILAIDGDATIDPHREIDRQACDVLERTYLENHFLQELLWLYARTGEHEKEAKTQELLEKQFKTEPVISQSELHGPEVQLVKFKNGVRAVFKMRSYKGESAAYAIDQLFSFHAVPFTIERELKLPNYDEPIMGSLQYFVTNTINPEHGIISSYATIEESKLRPGQPWLETDEKGYTEAAIQTGMEREPPKIQLFDYLTNHGDRWPGQHNFLFRQSGYPIAIDNSGILKSGNQSEKYLDKYPEKFDPGPLVLEKLRTITNQEIIKALTPFASTEEIHGLISRKNHFLKVISLKNLKSPPMGLLESKL